MISKRAFLRIINLIIKEEEAQKRFDEALREYAPSDFTGFAKLGILDELVDILSDLMQDEYDYLGWWLWDSPEMGRNPEFCKIWLGDEDDPNTEIVIVDTPEKLYDFMFTQYSKAPSKETLRMTVKAQDNGVKFALKKLEELKKTNTQTQNEGWENRNALLEYAQTQIENQYRFDRGIGADLHFQQPFNIISVLDEES